MTATVFNPMQIHLLQMFALDKNKSGLDELKDSCSQYNDMIPQG